MSKKQANREIAQTPKHAKPSESVDSTIQEASSSQSASGSKGKHSNRGGSARVAFAVIGVLLAVAVIAIIVVVLLVNAGRANLLGGNDAVIDSPEIATVEKDGKTIVYNGRTYRQKDDVVSICLIGNDKDARDPEEGFNGQADAVMIVALDASTGELTCIAVPRNSMVEVNRNYRGTDEFADTKLYQLCLAYGYGTDDHDSSKLVCTAVSRIMYNIPMNYYYTISLSGLVALADSVGGVTVEALDDIPYAGIYEGETVTLTGYDALSYVQWRDKYEEGSAQERQARQQQFLSALASQVLSAVKGNPAVIMDIVNTLADYSTTNLGPSEFAFLSSTVASTGVGSMNMTSLQGEVVNNDESEWEQFILDKDSVYQTVLDVYYEEVVAEPQAFGGAASSSGGSAIASSGASTVDALPVTASSTSADPASSEGDVA